MTSFLLFLRNVLKQKQMPAILDSSCLLVAVIYEIELRRPGSKFKYERSITDKKRRNEGGG